MKINILTDIDDNTQYAQIDLDTSLDRPALFKLYKLISGMSSGEVKCYNVLYPYQADSDLYGYHLALNADIVDAVSEETYFSRDTVNNYISSMKKLGVIEPVRKGMNAHYYMRIDPVSKLYDAAEDLGRIVIEMQ
jgi:hypothetical protein